MVMTLPIPENHPLRHLFKTLSHKNILGVVHLERPDIADYLTDLLARFARADDLRRAGEAMDRPLEDVGEMLLEADRQEHGGFAYPVREIRRHIGDFTLFFLGMFPEWVADHAT